MADLTRPDFGEVWATEGEKLSPDSAKIRLGWVREMMPYQYQNYLQARTDESLTYLFQKGIPEYSATQEYIANKSFVSYQGAMYLATATVTGVLPSTTSAWKRVSAISDTSGVVTVAGGGTGATTPAQARLNLGLGTASTLDSTYVVQKDENGNFSANIISASLNGNAATADKLKTPRQIKLVGAVESVATAFDGSANIDIATSKVDATKIEGVLSNDTTGTAAKAEKWTTPRKVVLSGAVTAVSSLSDGSQDFVAEVNSVNADFLNTGTVPTGRLGNAVVKTSATGAAKLPKGSTADRPPSPEFGDFRGNTSTSLLEYFNGTSWVSPQAYSSEYVLNRANHKGVQEIATISGLALSLPELVKYDRYSPCLIKTSATMLAIKAGTHVKIGSGYVSFLSQKDVEMPSVLTPGEDYAVFVHPDGTASAIADPYFDPAEAPVPGALKIGGFHYGLVAPGTTPASGGFATTGFTNTGGNYPWTQARVDRIAGINAFSIWDSMHRSKGEQRGFAFDPQTRVWIAIYFCSPDHITNGISRYNTPAASGTVPPKIPIEYGGDGAATYGRLSAYEALEILASHGCRLITQTEFASAAFGVTEGQSLGGAASTIPATKREPGYTSRIGIEQATGHIWTIGGPLTSVGGSAWVADPGRGDLYGTSGLPLFGGNRDRAANSGSRASNWNNAPWNSGWSSGIRAACDHYQGGY